MRCDCGWRAAGVGLALPVIHSAPSWMRLINTHVSALAMRGVAVMATATLGLVGSALVPVGRVGLKMAQ